MDVTSRKAVVSLLIDILTNGRSFQTALFNASNNANATPQIQAIAYGVLRHYENLNMALSGLLKKKMKNKDKDIELYLLIAFFQLSRSNKPDYAVVNETVKCIKKGKKRWAANLVNGILRNYCRALENHEPQKNVTELPLWMIEAIKNDWADKFDDIAQQSNKHAPMSIRVNCLKTTRDDYLKQLHDAGIDATKSDVVESGIVLTQAVPVDKLPNFAAGYCSVQDLAAQLATFILAPKAGDKILDACAAPGGKTCHILEQAENIEMVACDIDQKRLMRVEENLTRLQLKAQVKTADMADEMTFKAESFDRILLDAPCSALGIIRRHPDIKFLRKPADIEPLTKIQQTILANCWHWLKPKGTLVYATCSILKQENQNQIEQFLSNNNNAKIQNINLQIPSNCDIGLQILPGENQMDGFYYAKLLKT